MEWYNYLAVFFSGAFLCNAIPHFVHGISGDKFPSPFAKPPGKGLSSPMVNVLWGGLNLIIGFILLINSNLQTSNLLGLILFFAGVMSIAIMLGSNFSKKHKE